MASNHKLTSVIKGRAVTAIEAHGAQAIVRFDDGSTMTVQTAPGSAIPSLPSPTAAPRPKPRAKSSGRRSSATKPTGAASPNAVHAVRQSGTAFDLDLEGGTTLAFTTAEATSSVLLRDRAQKFEYSD